MLVTPFRKFTLLIAFIFAALIDCVAQEASLSRNFDRNEYEDLLWMQMHGLVDSMSGGKTANLKTGTYTRLLLTPEVGLFNRAAVFIRQTDSLLVLELRGTVNKTESWLENFYAGMVPANGSLQLSDGFNFNYKLAENRQAAVHLGWLIGTAFLSREYLPLLDSMVQKGYHQIMVSGHSQGGALSFLTTSFLHYHYKKMNVEVTMKTYASAAPKPGNLYYAYDFDHISYKGGAYRIINDADWVPETPISVQTVHDFNTANPFAGAKKNMKQQNMLVRLYLKNVYNQLNHSTAKASKKLQKHLGEKLYKFVRKPLPQLKEPQLFSSMNYNTAGIPIILSTTPAYQEKFVYDGKNVFIHHVIKPYLFLLNEWYPEKAGNK